MIEAKFAEIQDLFNEGSFQDVLRTEAPYGTTLITARYILAIKSDEDKEERYKARYVSDRHLDITKHYLAHGAQIIKCVSGCIIWNVAKNKCFRLWVVDIKLAYLESYKPHTRKSS